MIRNGIDQEFHLAGAIVCIHAHIYTDTVARSQELEAEVEGYFRELYKRLAAEGVIKPAYGGVRKIAVGAKKAKGR